jgi:hypothetical protein
VQVQHQGQHESGNGRERDPWTTYPRFGATALVTLLAVLLLFEAIAFNATLLESPQSLSQLCRTLETTRWIPAGRSGNIFPD